jgi:hypothetical protein
MYAVEEGIEATFLPSALSTTTPQRILLQREVTMDPQRLLDRE